VNLRPGLPKIRAKPKSASLSCPLDPINKLFGFISLQSTSTTHFKPNLAAINLTNQLLNKNPIPMQNPFFMANQKSFQSHLKVWFYVPRRKKYIWITNNRFEISLHELKHKMQVPFVRESIDQLNYIRVFKLFKQFNLSKCCKIYSFLLFSEPNFFYCNRLSCLQHPNNMN